jgi:hypothetical protein
MFYALGLGQVISLLLVGTGVCTVYLITFSELYAPATQNVPNYVVLSLNLLPGMYQWYMSKTPPKATTMVTPTRDADTAAGPALPAAAMAAAALAFSASEEPSDFWWKYALLSVVDVEANVLIVMVGE